MDDVWYMARALELAERGQGYVEPNPLVGCVVVRDGQVVGEGYHERYGGPHAEIVALERAGAQARGATLFVTLEPCCHHGKTPPCTEAILAAGVARVVAALADPFPQVAGQGIERLRAAGVDVRLGLLEADARAVLAPYWKRVTRGQPWMIAKWAMTLDGRIATRAGQSRWISGEASRALGHRLRGRMDAILVGRGTVEADDPLLTARPAGARTALRVVADSLARTPLASQLVRTARQAPVLIAVSAAAPADSQAALRAAGCEVQVCPGDSPAERLTALLGKLAERSLTNVLVEGGARLLGALFDAGHIDELHAFIAPRLVGGESAPGPLAGWGLAELAGAPRLADPRIERLGDDVYVSGRLTPAAR